MPRDIREPYLYQSAEVFPIVSRFSHDQGISVWPNLKSEPNVIALLQGTDRSQPGMNDGNSNGFDRKAKSVAETLGHDTTRVHLFQFAKNFIFPHDGDLDAQLHFMEKTSRLTSRSRILAVANALIP